MEVTRVVQKEVTRVVQASPTQTPMSENIDPSTAFSMDYLGAVEQDGVKVELARVIFMHRDAFKPDTSFDDDEDFDGQNYVGEIIWRITNNREGNIIWSSSDINVRVNDRQMKLDDYIYDGFGELPTDEIFPGSTIIGGTWFGIGSIKPDDINSVSLLMGGARDPDSYSDLTGDFSITADLSEEHSWFPLPDDLK